MMNWLFRGFTRLFGSRNEREVRKVLPLVEAINAREPEMQKLTDAELRGVTDKLKARLAGGETLDDILVDAFATVRECSKRTPPPGAEKGLRHFDVQLVGGIVLHQGKIAEMVTGEGKTLVGTGAAYLNALSGKGVHVITVNDYLARRDREWMGPIYEKLGLSVGVIQSEMGNAQRKAAYAADITYGTNNEFGFDYLRDNMKGHLEDQVQRRSFAILDEVDNILIDEARTPLIISGPSEGDVWKYSRADQVARRLEPVRHFEIKEKESQILLSEEGIEEAQKLIGVDSFYSGRNMEWPHHLEQALRAHHIYKKDVDYVVDVGESGQREVIIVDEFTGRLMPGRRWSDGLHQAVEAKEKIQVRAENQTLATITFQNFFKLYDKLAGMTGTAITEAGEFMRIYKLDVIMIPTNRQLVRKDYDDQIYANERDKFTAVVGDIMDRHKEGRPVLVGTTSIEKSERLSETLKRRGINHNVLNAKQHAREAEFIAQAGRRGSVTIATNMAGRGTDILLGGNPAMLARGAAQGATSGPEFETEVRRFEVECGGEKKEILEQGGLHVIGTERHEARRIDNQLRGRSGRQGDPGSTRFYLSLEDDLMRKFAGPRVSTLLGKLGLRDGQSIEHRWVTKSVERAQKKVEERNFEIRKRLLEYDEVMNEQRTLIYNYRQQILRGEGLRELLMRMVTQSLERAMDTACGADRPKSEWDRKGLQDWYRRKTGMEPPAFGEDRDGIEESLRTALERLYDERLSKVGPETLRMIERFVLLNAFDGKWKEHLYNMDALKSGIGLRAYANEDPKNSYKREGYVLFEEMLRSIEEEVSDYFYRIEVSQPEQAKDLEAGPDRWGGASARKDEFGSASSEMDAASKQDMSKEAPKPFRRDQPKVGRNDECPCGSGKKYKRCHGASAAG